MGISWIHQMMYIRCLVLCSAFLALVMVSKRLGLVPFGMIQFSYVGPSEGGNVNIQLLISPRESLPLDLSTALPLPSNKWLIARAVLDHQSVSPLILGSFSRLFSSHRLVQSGWRERASVEKNALAVCGRMALQLVGPFVLACRHFQALWGLSLLCF